jgi:hypothetical protein
MTTDDKTNPASASDDQVDTEAEEQKIWDELAAKREGGEGGDPAPDASGAADDPGAKDASAEPDPAAKPAAGEGGKEPAAAEPAAGKKTEPAKTAASDKTDGAAPDGAAPKDDTAKNTWADLTPDEQRAALEAAQSAKTRAEKAFSGMQRKINDLTQQVATLRTKAATPADDGAGAKTTTKEGADSKPKIPEKVAAKVAAMKEEYPELGAMLEDALTEMVASTTSEIAEVSDRLSGLTKKQQDEYLDTQVDIVAAEHADYAAALKSNEFKAWYETAPAYKQAAVNRNGEHFMDGREVSSLLEDFKKDTGWKTTAASAPSASGNGGTPPANAGKSPTPALSGKRQKQLASASSPRTGSPGTAVNGVPEDEEAAWNFFKDKHEREQRKGA